MGIQALYMAYFAHLIARDVYMTVTARRQVFSRITPQSPDQTAARV